MVFDLITLIRPFERISVLGMCKNAGKTTALNALIEGLFGLDSCLGITSIGRDGESTDTLTATVKPRIYVQKGTIAATAASLLPHSSITREILCGTGIPTQLGEIIVVRVQGGGFIELAGASTVSGINKLNDIMHHHGANKILIDGALSRKSLCRAADAVLLSTGASLSRDIDEVIDETAFACSLFCLSEYNSAEGENVRIIEGALTDTLLTRLIKSGQGAIRLVVEDAGKILCSHKTARLFFALGGTIEVMHSIKLVALTVNPVSAYGYEFNAQTFKNRLIERTGLPVFNVLEG